MQDRRLQAHVVVGEDAVTDREGARQLGEIGLALLAGTRIQESAGGVAHHRRDVDAHHRAVGESDRAVAVQRAHQLQLAAAAAGDIELRARLAFESLEPGDRGQKRQGVQAIELKLLADRRHAFGDRDLEVAGGVAAIQRHLLERRAQRAAGELQSEHGPADFDLAHVQGIEAEREIHLGTAERRHRDRLVRPASTRLAGRLVESEAPSAGGGR